MKTLVLVFIGMTSAFLAESCHGDRTQGQQSVLKIAKSTVEVHLMWHDIYVATETGGQMRAVVYYSVRLRKSDRERARDPRRDAQILRQFSANKQNRERGGSAVLFDNSLMQKWGLVHVQCIHKYEQ
jgi:hypothetical protein